MNNLKPSLMLFALILLATPCVRAQQEEAQGQAPEEANTAEQSGTSAALKPDTRPVSGVEEMRVESPGRSRNYVIPSLRVSAFGDSNHTIGSSQTTGFEMSGNVVGNLAVHRVTRRNDFSLDYSGGGIFYARNSQFNASMHQLGITETYQGRRWGITLGDRLAYLPESAFGFSGFGSGLGMGGGSGNWNPAIGSSQTLYSGRGPRISNNALVQVQYNASARSSFTLAGSYGTLRFKEPGYVESNFSFGTVGYNYALNRKDTVSVSYGFGAIRFLGSPFHVESHYGQISYGRRVTGRLAFLVSGGPQFVITSSPTVGTTRKLDWTAHTSLDYMVGRSSLNWSYGHYTSSGSGLFFGAKTDNVSGSFSNRLTRNWTWSIGPGYTRNASLSGGPSANPAFAFNSVYGSTSLNRNLGRYTDLAFSYTLHEQWSDALNPNGINEGSSYLRHFLSVSLTWHTPRFGLN